MQSAKPGRNSDTINLKAKKETGKEFSDERASANQNENLRVKQSESHSKYKDQKANDLVLQSEEKGKIQMPVPEEPREDEGAPLQQIQEPVLADEPTINDDEGFRHGQDAQILIEGVP